MIGTSMFVKVACLWTESSLDSTYAIAVSAAEVLEVRTLPDCA
jgi:hypothetical protein